MTTSDRTVDDPADFPDDTQAESVAKLIAQGTVTVQAVLQLSTAIHRHTLVQQWAIGLGFVVLLLLSGVAVDNRVQLAALRQSTCPLITIQIPAAGDAQPVTQHGRDVVRAARDLASQFHCDLP